MGGRGCPGGVWCSPALQGGAPRVPAVLGGGESSWSPKAAFLRLPAADRSQSQNQSQLHCPQVDEPPRETGGAGRTPGPASSPGSLTALWALAPQSGQEPGKQGKEGRAEASSRNLLVSSVVSIPSPRPGPPFPPGPSLPSAAEVSAFDEKLLQLYSGGGKRRVTPRGSPGLIEK